MKSKKIFGKIHPDLPSRAATCEPERVLAPQCLRAQEDYFQRLLETRLSQSLFCFPVSLFKWRHTRKESQICPEKARALGGKKAKEQPCTMHDCQLQMIDIQFNNTDFLALNLESAAGLVCFVRYIFVRKFALVSGHKYAGSHKNILFGLFNDCLQLLTFCILGQCLQIGYDGFSKSYLFIIRYHRVTSFDVT
jgi:hypothetical protein